MKRDPESRRTKSDVPLPPERFFKRRVRNSSPEERSGLPRGIAWGVFGIFLLFVGGFIVSFYIAKHELTVSLASHTKALNKGIEDLKNLDTEGADQEFSALDGDLSGAKGLMDNFDSLFQEGSGPVVAFTDLSNQLGMLSQELEALKSDAFGILGGAQNMSIAPHITALRDTVDAINADTDTLSSVSSPFGGPSPLNGSDYISLKTQLHDAKSFLDALTPWIATTTPHHILVFLQNPSEIRPGGGFLGSYADVTIASGTITNIDVRDVADVDAGFAANIVPPKPLQLEVKRWRPADANWFFDFRTSASQTISFFEQSDLYNASTSASSLAVGAPVSFDGAIAISPKVISDLLAVTGSITVGHPSTTFTADNFLVQIQKIVQTGQAQSETYPKQVLRDLMSNLLGKLASSTDPQEQQLIASSLDWVNKREVMAYFKDPDFENLAMTYGVAGDVYELPQNFNGDYLAVVDANVNGGKSDLYVSSTVQWEDQIGADGTLSASVIVARKHNGNQSPYWWYHMTNQDYLQLFVPDGSTLTNESGGSALKIVPKINYIKDGYSTDPLVASLEATNSSLFDYPAVMTHEESGREVFSTWVVTKLGATTQLSFNYTHHLFILPAPGVVYQFIFEKQAGTSRDYIFDIDAPLGYQFAETGLSTYHYESTDPPGRLMINLTLEKI